MNILALDLSITSTGYSIVSIEGKDKNTCKVKKWGKIETKPKDFKNEDLRINYIVDTISDIIKDSGEIDILAVENQFISPRANTIMILRKLLGAVCRMSYKEYGLEVMYIAPTSVKKFITGSGKAKKDDVAKVIRENYIDIGEYSDSTGKKKTSDIYDAISVAIAVGCTI